MQKTISIALPKERTTTSLSESAFLRYVNFIALYFAQGVPEGMLLFGIPAWMAMNGKTPGEIAGFAVACGLPWSFKFIVAPMMDRYTYLAMGRKRPWVIIGQLGLIASCIFMAYVPDPLNNLNLLMIAGFLVAFFGSFQDVATDGMAIDVIPAHQQPKANGFMWGAKVIGISSALALGSWLLNKYSFTTAMLTLALIIGIIMLVPLFSRERQGEKLTPWSPGKASPETKQSQLASWAAIFKSLYSAFSLRHSLLLAVILFIAQGAYNYMSTILPIFTVKGLNWTNMDYSQYYSVAKIIGGITGMLIGGVLIDKFGKKRMMNIYFFSLVFFTGILAFSKTYWTDASFIYAYMMVYNVLVTFGCIGIFAISMQCCWKKISASQFTLYMTIGNLGRIALAALIGPITTHLSWQMSIFSFAVMVMVAWLLLQFLNIDKQVRQVSDLENKDMVTTT